MEPKTPQKSSIELCLLVVFWRQDQESPMHAQDIEWTVFRQLADIGVAITATTTGTAAIGTLVKAQTRSRDFQNGGSTNIWVYVYMHQYARLARLGGCSPRKFLEIRSSEVASEAILGQLAEC